ncbi:hypothetical protein MRB53_039141 [Persea americana]|nr:hypothetical protein MRB53_039141 [Persea americana]
MRIGRGCVTTEHACTRIISMLRSPDGRTAYRLGSTVLQREDRDLQPLILWDELTEVQKNALDQWDLSQFTWKHNRMTDAVLQKSMQSAWGSYWGTDPRRPPHP